MRIALYLLSSLLLAACTSQTVDISPDSASPTTTVANATSPPGATVTVTRVFDGDSLIAELDDGTEVEVRLLGINAPEGSECHGDAAKATLEQLVESGPVVLVEDAEDTDQFNRLLRYLYVDGLNVNLAMIANGDALALQGDHSRDAEFAAIADAAAESGIGMWAADACGDNAPLPPVAIVDYVYNPGGRDSDDMNGEWVAIANTGSQQVDLGGWILRDESTQNRFQFPAGFELASDTEVVVHVGCGDDSQTDLYWCAKDPIWSNGGDTAILQLPSGTVVSRDRFDGDF